MNGLNMNYASREWESLKQWLLQAKERKTDLLLRAETWDDSNKIRGSISFINEILAQEKAALSSR